jgi:beta-glucosidase
MTFHSPLLTRAIVAGSFVVTGVFAADSSDIDRRAAELVGQMTLEEKIGQMIQADYLALQKHEEDVTTFAMGSVLNGGSSDPGDNSPKAWADAVDRLQRRALATRLKIPLLYGIDAVHGNNNVPGAVIFPHNIGLGATRDPQLVERVERITALETLATGPNWAFAPGVIVGRDERWGRTYESFGEDPALVAQLGAAAIRGFQTPDLAGPSSVLACAKHYLGDGGTTGGIDQGNAVCDEPTLRRLYLPPYVEAVRAGVGSVMISYSSWNGEKMHGNRRLITDVLKGELGFRGFTVSDWAAIDQLTPDYVTDIEKAINAGLDMVMIPWGPGSGLGERRPVKHDNTYAVFAKTLAELVHSGRVSEARVTDAAERIIRVKLAMHLFDRPFANRTLLTQLGSPDHRAVAREAAQHSLVLLKNDQHVLPIAATAKHVHVIGAAADDIGAQCGGWTVSWQGSHGTTTRGTSLIAGLRQVAPAGCTITFDQPGLQPVVDADVTIVVIAEEPYAEGKGDRKNLALPPRELDVLRALRRTKNHVVLVLLSGRPVILGDALTLSDAIVAAWLPGTEGAGVADVLFGAVKPTGKLPVSWPRAMTQIPINVGDAKYDPLFPFGHGLTY